MPSKTPPEPLVFARTPLFLTHCLGQLEEKGISLRRAAGQLGTSPSTLSRLATGVSSTSQMDILIDLLSLMASLGIPWEEPLHAMMGHTVEAKYKPVLHAKVKDVIQETLIGLKSLLLAAKYPIPKKALKNGKLDLIGAFYDKALENEQNPGKRQELLAELKYWRGRERRVQRRSKPWAQDSEPITHVPSGLEYLIEPQAKRKRKKGKK